MSWTAAASVSRRRVRSAAPLRVLALAAQPVEDAGRPSRSRCAASCSSSPMAQVGERRSPSVPEHRGSRPSARRLEAPRRPRVARTLGPGARVSATPSVSASPPVVEARRSGRGTGSGPPPGRGRAVRLLERLEQRQPVVAAGVAKTGHRRREPPGRPTSGSAAPPGRRWWRSARTATSPAQRPAVEGRARAEQRPTSAARSRRCARAAGPIGSRVAPRPEVVAATTRSRNGAARRPGEAGAGGGPRRRAPRSARHPARRPASSA